MELSRSQRQFAAEWINSLIPKELQGENIPEDLLILVFRELSRQEEIECDRRDQWGNWEWPFSQAAIDGTLWIPRLDIAINDWIKSISSTKSLFQWPDHKHFAICLTHDVDFISRRTITRNHLNELIRRCWKIREGRFQFIVSYLFRSLVKYFAGPFLRFNHEDEYHQFDLCIELEAKYGFKSTFFFLAENLPQPHTWDCGYCYDDPVSFFGQRTTVRGMISEMLQRGCDVGLHGSYYSAINPGFLKEEKQQLENCAGTQISSVRHHYLHYDAGITPSLHQQAGLTIDSTIGFNRTIGFRSGTAFPYYCWDHQAQHTTNVLEVPLHLMDGSLLTSQGLECDTVMATTYIRMMMDRVASVGGCLTINWHPSWMSLKQYRKVYEFILKEAYQRNGWGCSINELYKYWLDMRL
ncbi:MAG TPA: polysaccharide deacetylase family protein [Syntrophorhabdus sp.]|nr:polysaccharide deacetylase family protein [Syntrophorhabdus sp.]